MCKQVKQVFAGHTQTVVRAERELSVCITLQSLHISVCGVKLCKGFA